MYNDQFKVACAKLSRQHRNIIYDMHYKLNQ